MSIQHIGAAGELLVQYQLLKLGIDSARLTTDAGIDLVVYAPGDRSASTVQVQANLGPKQAGGRGPLSRGWHFPHQCPAQLVALVALDTDTVWLFALNEAREFATHQRPLGPGGHVRALPTAGCPGRRASREMLMTPQVVEALTAWSDRNR